MRDVVEMGMDHVAHLTVRDAPGSDALRDTIAFLKAHGTVIDPTISWNELLGRSPQTPIESFQPGIAHVAPPLRRLIDGANGGAVTPQQARDRLARSLQIIKALHDAGIPIVAGTDKGVPGVSVAREIELYVAGRPLADGRDPRRDRGPGARDGARERQRHDRARACAPISSSSTAIRSSDIADIRNVRLVAVNGRLYDATRLWAAGGFR